MGHADGQRKFAAIGAVTVPCKDVEPVTPFAQRAGLPDGLRKEGRPIRVDAFQPGSESDLVRAGERVGRKTDSKISLGVRKLKKISIVWQENFLAVICGSLLSVEVKRNRLGQ